MGDRDRFANAFPLSSRCPGLSRAHAEQYPAVVRLARERYASALLVSFKGESLAAPQPTVADRKGASLAALLEQIIEAAPDPIWAKDEAGRFILLNSAAASIMGQPRDRVLGRTAAELAPADIVRRIEAEDARVLREGASVSAEDELFDHNSARRAVYLSRKVPLRGPDGAITGLLGLAREITDRKRYEAMLVAREAKSAKAARELQTLADNIPTLCFMAFPDGHIYWFNRRCYDYTGLSWDSPSHWEHVIEPSVLPEASERWSRSVRTGEPFEMTVPVRGGDGHYRTFLTRIVPIRNEAGAIVRWFGSNTDVTDLKASEAERERLSSIIESTSDFVGTFDRNCLITYLNPAARRLANIPAAASLAGCGLDRIVSPEHIRKLVDEILPIVRRDGVWTGESSLHAQDGTPIPASHVVIGHRDERDEIAYFSFVARDISDRVAAEDREKLLAREVDHRAKNLLAIVQSVVQLTRAESVTDFKDAITGRVQSLARAHSLLAASRWQGVQLGPLIEEELAPFSPNDNPRVRASGPAILLKPAAAQAIALVVHELATNTVKYGALSCDAGRLDVRWRRVEREGAPHLAIVWHESGGPTVTPPAHRGFGSTVIRSSVERQLKGKVEMEWRATGLQCTLTFPTGQVLSQPEPARARRSSPRGVMPSPAPLSLAGRKVLVVEDEALIAAQVEAVLGDAGCTVIGPAADIAEALTLAAGSPPDVAVLDVNLAGERSDPIADVLAARGIPFLFCTGYAGAAAPERYPGARVLKKPLDPAELLQAIGQLAG